MARGDKPYLRKSTDRKAQIRKAFVQFSSVQFSGLICALRSVDFSGKVYHPEPPHAQSLFLFLIVFGINIPFDWRRALLPETVSHTINFVRLLVTLEKREGAYALFVQKTPDMSWKIGKIKVQNILQIRKGLFSRGVTGWMLHFNVCNTNCLLNNMYLTLHVVEKAIGVTHIEMKHPACYTAAQKSLLNLQDFLYLIICTLFVPLICLARPCSRFVYRVSCLSSSLTMRHGERHVTPAPRMGSSRTRALCCESYYSSPGGPKHLKSRDCGSSP